MPSERMVGSAQPGDHRLALVAHWSNMSFERSQSVSCVDFAVGPELKAGLERRYAPEIVLMNPGFFVVDALRVASAGDPKFGAEDCGHP